MYLVFSMAGLLIMGAALVDMITIDSTRVKHLPKMAWIVLVILLPAIGGVIWFAVGREYLLRADRGSFGDAGRWADPERGPFARPDLAVRDAEAELAALNREIAQSERAERIRKLESELEEKRRERGSGS